MSNFQKIILSIAIATMFVSYCLGANVLIQSVHGFFLVISVLIIAAAIKSGEGIFAHLATVYFLEKKYFLSAFFAGLCALLLAVSVSGTTMFLLIQHTKDTAKLEAAKEFLMTKEKDVEFARQELHGCKSTHVTKCVLPKTAILNEKIAERDEAAKKFAKYTDAKGIDTAWNKFAEFVGVSSGDDENSVNTEIFRNLALATLADVIAMILIAVVHLQFFKSEPKDEVKKTISSGRRDDDFFEPDYNDYKQPERTFNREPSLPNKSQELLSDLLERKENSLSNIDDFMNGVKNGENIMDELTSSPTKTRDNVLVCGAKGSGKTSLLARIAEERLKVGEVLLIDPHAKPARWPGGVVIKGAKGNYNEVKQTFEYLFALMKQRNHEYYENNLDDREFPIITVITDEISSMKSSIEAKKIGLSDVIGDYIADLTSQGRKFGIDFVIGCHADTAESLGLTGKAQVLNNFDVFAYLNNNDGNRTITVKKDRNSKQSKAYQHPGAFISNGEKSSIPDFKQTIKNIVTPNVKNLKNLNGDIFPV